MNPLVEVIIEDDPLQGIKTAQSWIGVSYAHSTRLSSYCHPLFRATAVFDSASASRYIGLGPQSFFCRVTKV